MLVDAPNAYFIKLGRGGGWEDECLKNGTIRFGYAETPPDLCTSGDWDAVQEFWRNWRQDGGVATRNTTQIRIFYEATPEDVFITFRSGLLYWRQPTGEVEVLEDGNRIRATVAGWRSESINGSRLTTDRLAGFLLKVQMYRGTICRVKTLDYLLDKINDRVPEDITAAEEAENLYLQAMRKLIGQLDPKDFEVLVDLVFTASGWRRLGIIGKAQRSVDTEMVSPTTREPAFVQVKAQAKPSDLETYLKVYSDGVYDKMFFVWHSSDPGGVDLPEGVYLINPESFASMVVESGLASWVKEKVQ